MSIVSFVRPIEQLIAGIDVALGHDFEAHLKRTAEAEVRSLCRTQGVPQHCGYVRIGLPEVAIAEFASANEVDLVVLGAHDRNGLEYFLGTTATAVLHRAHCDVPTRGSRCCTERHQGRSKNTCHESTQSS